jgi:hypothetical protein
VTISASLSQQLLYRINREQTPFKIHVPFSCKLQDGQPANSLNQNCKLCGVNWKMFDCYVRPMLSYLTKEGNGMSIVGSY